jgi:branched-chain amino acid transport system permease protein
MVGSFIAMWIMQAMGFVGQSHVLYGLPLVGVLFLVLIVTMLCTGVLGAAIERYGLRALRNVSGTAPMITTIGISYILFNLILLSVGADSKNYTNPMPNIRWEIGEAVVRLREVLLWSISILLMFGLHYFVRNTKMGKAMQATAQDQEAARMMGVDVDRVVIITFFLGSALAGAAGFVFGLYYNYTSFLIGYTAGLRAFTAAVLGGIGNLPGAMLGGVLIGLIESLGGQYLEVRWTDVIIFSILVLVLVFRPTGLLGRPAPAKS